jgi:ATP-dependent helicase HrpA
VLASEQISLFGLVLAPKKPVHYGRIAPQEAHEIFVRQGLVTGEINTRAGFVADHLKTLEQAREEEAKLRRAGIVADEDWQARWYLDRIPSDLHSAAGLDAWHKKLAPEARHALHWSLPDLLPGEGSEEDRFPKYFPLGDARLAVRYRFEPGAIDDGMTVVVPLHLLNALDAARLSWLAPGFVADKATALIRSLPKLLRRNFVPAPDFGRAFAEAHPQPEADGIEGALARFLKKLSGVELSAADFDEAGIEPHLRANLRLLDFSPPHDREAGRGRLGGGALHEGHPSPTLPFAFSEKEGAIVLAESRDLGELRERFGKRAAEAFARHAAQGMAQAGLVAFPTQPIPVSVPGAGGVPAYPALQDDGGSASLAVHARSEDAERLHPQGVRRLLALALADKLKQARRQLPVQPRTSLLYAAIESRNPRVDGLKDADRLRADLVDGAFAALTEHDLLAIRDPVAFEQRRDAISKHLFAEAMRRLQQAETILGLVAGARTQLESKLVGWASGNLDDMRAQLEALAHPGFLREVPAEMLAEYPRWLKALALRAERAQRDPARDQQRMLELAPFVEALAQADPDDAETRALRAELEELRVQLFAQELGAKGGVSPKKLAQRVQRLRRVR